jgi:hypothetical protein
VVFTFSKKKTVLSRHSINSTRKARDLVFA